MIIILTITLTITITVPKWGVSGFSKSLDDDTDLHGGVGTGARIQSSLGQLFTEMGATENPTLQFVIRRPRRGVGTIQLGQFCAAVNADLKGTIVFHNIIILNDNNNGKESET